MTNARQDGEFSEQRIQRDLASFADSNTKVDVVRDGHRFRASWIARGKTRDVTFNDEDYRSIVAGHELADLRSVAEVILRSSRSSISEPFVSTRAKRDDSEVHAKSGAQRPAIDILTDLLESDNSDATRVVMLTGAAGAGKTRVLRELVRRQAERYLHGQTTKLLLYVNAQGRALARLEEALAAEIDDLKVVLFYHSVAVLTRLGMLVPVIDGFDELLGVRGYEDSFSSLAGFLEQLDGEGQLLVSARSVYYEEEFLARAASVSSTDDQQSWEQIPVRVADWSEQDRSEYLNNWMKRRDWDAHDREKFRRRIYDIFRGDNSPLASKPLFFTRAVSMLAQNPTFSGGTDLLQDLVGDYQRREQNEKLLDRNSTPLLTEAQFERLMRELAEEMWNQDTRELDYRSVKVIAEYVVEDENLSENAKTIIIERIPSLAFLGSGKRPAIQTGAFEHELFFFYFLGRCIANRLSSLRGDMRLMLSRAALPEDVSERVAVEVGGDLHSDSGRLQEFVQRLVDAGRTEWVRTAQVRENAGLLIMALFRKQRRIEECDVHTVVFPGSDLSGVTMTRCSLVDVTIRRTDLSNTQFSDCSAQNVLFVEPCLDPDTTRLELRGIGDEAFSGIRVPDRQTSYDPTFVRRILIACGAPISENSKDLDDRGVREDFIKLLDRLIAAYRRMNLVCKADDNLKSMFRDPWWEKMEKLLVDHDLVRREIRAKSGRRTVFLRRRFLPEELMAGFHEVGVVDPRVRAFWKDLELEMKPAGDQGSAAPPQSE